MAWIKLIVNKNLIDFNSSFLVGWRCFFVFCGCGIAVATAAVIVVVGRRAGELAAQVFDVFKRVFASDLVLQPLRAVLLVELAPVLVKLGY